MFNNDQIKPVVILLYALSAATVWKYSAFPNLTECTLNNFWKGTTPLFAAFILFGIIPIGIIKWGFKEKLSNYGLQLGNVKRTLRTFLLAVPVVAVIAIFSGALPEFSEVYPLNATLRNPDVEINFTFFVIHSLCYLGYYFGWEFMFRGFMQHGLAGRCGLPTAVLIQTSVSTMLHYGHPAAEVYGAIIGGIVWGFFAYRTQSLLSGWGQHALLGIVLDYVLIFNRVP